MGEDGEWLWLSDPLVFGRALGRFILEVEPVLVLETEVEGAVEYARQLLGHLAGKAVVFRAVPSDVSSITW